MNKKVSEIVKEVKAFCDYNYIFFEDYSYYDNKIDIYNMLTNNIPCFNKSLLKIEKVNKK